MNFTRRCFLSYLSASAADVFFMPKFGLANDIASDKNWLSFCHQTATGPWIDETTLIREHTALHKETKLPVKNIEKSSYTDAVSVLKKMLADRGVRWKNSYRTIWAYQHFGVADRSIHSERLLSYAKAAQDYLYNSVAGLSGDIPSWDFLPTMPGTNIETNGFRGFVGKHSYLVYWISAMDEGGTLIQPGMLNIMPVERAINYIVENKNDKPTGCTIFLIHGATSLISPFSELIHLTTHQPTLRYANELTAFLGEGDAQMVGRIYGESVTEAAGIILAQEFLKKYRRTDELSIVEEVSRNMIRYPLLKAAIAYMKKKSVQYVLNSFSENPKNTYLEIKRMADEFTS